MPQTKLPVLSPIHQTFVLLIETEFNHNGQVPSKEWIAEQCSLSLERIEELFDDSEANALFWTTLQKKYLDGYYKAKPNAGLSADQLLVMDILLDPNDKRSQMQKLKAARKTSHWLAAQLKDPIFANEINRRSKDIFRNRAYEVRNSIASAAANGDIKAATMYMEMIGEYVPRSHTSISGTINVETNTTVRLLVEVIQRHCSPEQVSAIASDFDRVLNGEQLPPAVIEAHAVAVHAPARELPALPVDDRLPPPLAGLISKSAKSPEQEKLLRELFSGFDDA